MNTNELVQYVTSTTKYFLRNRTPNESIDYLDGYSIEDITQDSLVKLMKSKVKPQTKTYVSQVVLSVISDLRKKGTLPRLSKELTEEIMDPTVIPRLTSEDLLENLKNSLDLDTLELFTSYYESLLSIHDIALLRGVSERTIKRRLHELTNNIQDFLSHPDPGS